MGLSASWINEYISALRNLSNRKAASPEGKHGLRFLKKLAQEAYVEGRGKVLIPKADTNGYYPDMSKPDYKVIKTAVRSNSKPDTRKRMWRLVTSSFSPTVRATRKRSPSPHYKTTLSTRQQRSFLKHAAVALPHEKGKYPAALGKRVPGEIAGRSSVISIKNIDPEDWKKGGFTMSKFSHNETPIRYTKKLSSREQQEQNKHVRRAIGGAVLTGAGAQVAAMGGMQVLRRRKLRKEVAKTGKQHLGNLMVTKGLAHPDYAHIKRKGVRIKNIPARSIPESAMRKSIQKGWAKSGVGKSLHQMAGNRFRETRTLLGVGGGLLGLGTLIQRRAAKKLKTVRENSKTRFAHELIPPVLYAGDSETQYYENEGFLAGLKKKWRNFTWRVGNVGQAITEPIKRDYLPAISKRIIHDNLTQLNTSIGLPDTSLDHSPIKRLSIGSEFAKLTNIQLRSMANALAQRMVVETDSDLKKALQRRISSLHAELIGRQSLQ